MSIYLTQPMKHVLLSLYNKNVHKISMLSTTLIDAFLPIALVRCCIMEKYAFLLFAQSRHR